MNNDALRRLATALLVACTILSTGCNLAKSRNTKACEKMAEYFPDPKTSAKKMKAGCLAELDDMKKKDKKHYECTTKCFAESAGKDAASACLLGCEDQRTTTTSATSDTGGSAAVDALTPSSLKGKVASEYQHFGYDISSEMNNGAGWSATVTLGKKGPSGEVHIYKVLLVDVNGHDDGLKVVSSLQKGTNESRVGRRKALYVECMYQRASYESGTPRSCQSYDSRISSFADDLGGAH
jgi:hypothetical protein